MIFKRKIYNKLLQWKNQYADQYAVLIEGARRVGKSTIVETFAKNEYASYLLIDFANVSETVRECFDDISDLDIFFLRLQAAVNVTLVPHDAVIIFDEVQLFPRARQAIKYLVKDGRYHYIETGSLISIKKNVQNILLPSEELKIQMTPMDYEEFCQATNNSNYELIQKLYQLKRPVGEKLNRKLMRDFRIYMAVGGMPQAVEAFISEKNFADIDFVKRQIITLYEDDFKKIDNSGKISAIFHDIPAQLSQNKKRYVISAATQRRKSSRDTQILYDLLDSKTVLAAYNTSDPRVSLASTKNNEDFKLYLCDTGLFITLMFMDRPQIQNEIYAKLLSDKLPANLGYLYENVVAQTIASKGHELYYHTWKKPESRHYYEVDFLISEGEKVSAIEVKSSGTGKHASLDAFRKKYAKNIKNTYVLSQKDVGKKENNQFLPIYMTACIL